MSKENIYFTDANTCSGYITFIDEYLKRAKEVIVLSGMSDEIRERVFCFLKSKFSNEFQEFTILLECSEEDRKVSITADKNLMYVDQKILPKGFSGGKIIDFSDCYFDLEFKKEIEAIKKETDSLKQKMYAELSKAKKIHDAWEKIYIDNMDFDVLNHKTDILINDIISGRKSEKEATNKNGFFGSMLPFGNVNYIDEITKGMKKRIFIYGRPGTGKSTIMKKVRKAANESGFDTKTFYCSFDANSLDMVVIEELGVCIFDATSPHEKIPKDSCDEVFDVYEIAVKKDTDKIYKNELLDIKNRYDECIKNAKKFLRKIKELEKETEKILNEKTDYAKVSKKLSEL